MNISRAKLGKPSDPKLESKVILGNLDDHDRSAAYIIIIYTYYYLCSFL